MYTRRENLNIPNVYMIGRWPASLREAFGQPYFKR